MTSCGEFAHVRKEVRIVLQRCRIERLDQPFFGCLADERCIEIDDVVVAGIGTQFGEHFRIGADVVVDDFGAGALLELRDGPGLVCAPALPV